MFFFFAFIASAQQHKGIVYYGSINAIGTGNAKGPDSNAYLIFNKTQSYYVTAKDSLEKAERINEQKTFLKDDDSGGAIYNGMKVSAQGDQVVYNLKNKIIHSNILYGKQIYVVENAEKIHWKILPDIKKIGKFTVKKAIANFRGRKYTAWYTPEITVPYGPWKLNGLPGLILEAYDEGKFAYWYFKSFEYPTANKENVNNIRKGKNEKPIDFLSLEEFKKFCKDEVEKSYEKMILIAKQHPGIKPLKGTVRDYFVEVFE
ncbi:GLPGLI family protein [Flavobacterium enshiense]|uniref:GLPGLI family protein n=1 Tax=Flavobacterium enshiense TaxID=1341165 RepID=UPI00345C8D18